MQALTGIRVLDLGTYLAGPFCATVLAEFGADVIKIELPNDGDGLRRFGTETDCGDTLVWLSEARNKRSLTLNLSSSAGRDILRTLIAQSDIVVENFRPGVLEKWGLDYAAMKETNSKVILLRVSAYGQTGPNRDMPGFARIAHAFSGLALLAGEPGRPPVTPGSTSLADYVTGLYAVVGVLLALQARGLTGEGQCIDLALYETMFRTLDELAPAYQQFQYVRGPMGADAANLVPHSYYQAMEGEWIAIACSNDTMFARLADAMERPELASAEQFGQMAARVESREFINGLVAEWVRAQRSEEVLGKCQAAQVPAAPLLSIERIFENPQYQHRGNISVVDSRIGPLAVPGVLPSLSATPGRIKWLGEGLGSSTDEILTKDLGLSPGMVAELRNQGVV